MRKILLLTVAGLASLASSAWGLLAWWRSGVASSHSILFIFPALTIATFALYLRSPLIGLIAAWLLLTGGYIAAFLIHLRACMGAACTTADSLRLGGQTLTAAPYLGLMFATAACLLFAYTLTPAPKAGPIAGARPDQDLGK